MCTSLINMFIISWIFSLLLLVEKNSVSNKVMIIQNKKFIVFYHNFIDASFADNRFFFPFPYFREFYLYCSSSIECVSFFCFDRTNWLSESTRKQKKERKSWWNIEFDLNMIIEWETDTLFGLASGVTIRNLQRNHCSGKCANGRRQNRQLFRPCKTYNYSYLQI